MLALLAGGCGLQRPTADVRDVRVEAATPEGLRLTFGVELRNPNDVALPILFLCSDWARHITGEVLNINGGSVLCG